MIKSARNKNAVIINNVSRNDFIRTVDSKIKKRAARGEEKIKTKDVFATVSGSHKSRHNELLLTDGNLKRRRLGLSRLRAAPRGLLLAHATRARYS